MTDEAEVWNVLTMKDGNVSLLKNLTADECRAVVQRIRGGDPWSQEAIHEKVLATRRHPQNPLQSFAMMGHSPEPGWGMHRCEWWGSRGGKLEIWPKPDDYDARLAEAFKIAALVTTTNEGVDRMRSQRAA